MAIHQHKGSTQRTQQLRDALISRALSDRSGEWLSDDMFPCIAEQMSAKCLPVIERRAVALRTLLQAMTDPAVSKTTHTFEIEPGQLLAGTMPLGSLGLGKIFPDYLTEEEKSVAFYSARGVESNLGHNSPDYTRVVRDGLNSILAVCKSRRQSLEIDRDHPMGKMTGITKKIGFYNAVETCCHAIKDYAHAFAKLATKQASAETDPDRKAELHEIARICRKVPIAPAETFHEALQSIWFVHLVLHASVSHLSLGRLDQVLQPYYETSLAAGQIDRKKAVELIECFFLKAAGRLNLNPAYFEKQDHQDFGTGMGHSPFLLDQEATINQYMQNIVVAGLTPDGKDATNECTHLFLEACANLGLSTPTVNVRLSKNSSKELIKKVSECIYRGDNGMPIVYNDDIVIPGLMQNARVRKIQKAGRRKPTYQYRSPSWSLEEARDYVVDGCWEPILNGICDFTYNMVHVLEVLECALNGGALLSTGHMQLRGAKRSYLSKLPDQMTSFDDLKEAFHNHLQLYTKRVGLQLYANFCLEGSVTPAPLFSSLLGQCLRKGIDKTWGGADHIIGGIVFIAMPNVANSLAAIQEWVFQKQKYTLPEVVQALRNNYEGAEQMWKDFNRSPKFGNADPEVDGIMKWLVDEVYDAVQEAQMISDKVFLTIPRGSEQGRYISALRSMAMYTGRSYREQYGYDFDIHFTAGCGTFAQYAFFGIGYAASADGRGRDEPVAPNFSPASGTAQRGIGSSLESLKQFGLERFGCGVMTDYCLERNTASAEIVEEIIKKHLANCGSIMSLTIAQRDRLEQIHEICNEVRKGRASAEKLKPYTDVTVRAGGWNSLFITLTCAQQKDYLKRTTVKP